MIPFILNASRMLLQVVYFLYSHLFVVELKKVTNFDEEMCVIDDLAF